MKAPVAEFRLIGPDDALQMLEKNTRNRNLRKGIVAQYAKDMRAGRWEMTGDAIRFEPGGTLLDGQHRLHACVEADVAFMTLVIEGVSGQGVMDVGPRRTFADHIKIQGIPYSVQIASAARTVAIHDEFKTLRSNPRPLITFHDILKAYEKRPTVYQKVAFETTSLHGRSDKTVSHTFYCGLHMLFMREDADTAEWYRARLFDGVNLKHGEPVRLVRKAFASQSPTRMMTTQQKLALVILGFNYTLAGEDIEHLRWIANGPRAEEFPTVGGKV